MTAFSREKLGDKVLDIVCKTIKGNVKMTDNYPKSAAEFPLRQCKLMFKDFFTEWQNIEKHKTSKLPSYYQFVT